MVTIGQLLASMHLSKNQSLIDVFTEMVRVHDHENPARTVLELAALDKLFVLILSLSVDQFHNSLLDFLLLYFLVRVLGQAARH